MKRLLPLLLIPISIYINSCANQVSPTGGPKDTIPPVLVNSFPEHKTTNYQGKTFKLQFNERINTDKLKQNLIITPFTENKYEVKTKKNEVLITFEESFDSLSTYTLNFANGITDITEKTPAQNLTLAFSTGPFIDSISVSGKAIDLYNNQALDQILIAIFNSTDTLDILTGKPKYFATTDTAGHFKIENIKNGYYKVYAFKDTNNNMKNDPEDEPHAILEDSIDLNTNQKNLILRLQHLDIRPLKFNRSKYTGSYFDMTYNKYLAHYNIQVISNPKQLPLPKHNLIGDHTAIRFYYDSTYHYERDSIGIVLTANDSLLNQTIDTTFIKFRSSKRKPEAFTTQIQPKNRSKINSQIHIKINFNKPIEQFSLDSIALLYDTLFFHQLPDTLFQWNNNYTQLSTKITLEPNYFKKQIDSLKTIYSDTTNKDSTNIKILSYLNKIDTLKVQLKIPSGAFISVENDTTQQYINSYLFKKPGDYGSVSGHITTAYNKYTLQLVTEKYSVIAQVKDLNKYQFKNIPPGKYTFRVLIDLNEDGFWDYGNLLKNKEPEPIYFYEEVFDVRSNWQLDNINLTF